MRRKYRGSRSEGNIDIEHVSEQLKVERMKEESLREKGVMKDLVRREEEGVHQQQIPVVFAGIKTRNIPTVEHWEECQREFDPCSNS